MKNNKGITLVALVVTIIVLLILAAVSINLVLGENGIITRAKKASESTKVATEGEQVELDNLFQSMEEELEGKTIKIRSADLFNAGIYMEHYYMKEETDKVTLTTTNRIDGYYNYEGKIYKAVMDDEYVLTFADFSTSDEVTNYLNNYELTLRLVEEVDEMSTEAIVRELQWNNEITSKRIKTENLTETKTVLYDVIKYQNEYYTIVYTEDYIDEPTYHKYEGEDIVRKSTQEEIDAYNS